MRPLTRTFVVATLLLLPVSASAQSLTIRDLLALHTAGLGDDVLIAMIEVDKPVFTLFPLDVLDLRKQGLSDRVIVKMIETRRIVVPAVPVAAPAVPVQAPPVAPARDDADDEDARPAPRSSRSSTPPPVIVEQTVVQEVRVEAPRRQPEYVQVPVYVPVVVPPRVPVKEAEPVYWGFGGQRRPGTWNDPPKTTTPPKPTGGGGF